MDEQRFIKIVQTITGLTVFILSVTLLFGFAGIFLFQHPEFLKAQKPLHVAALNAQPGEVFTDSIHNATGFIQGEHLDLVIANCTGCHSSKLIIQNRATEEGWKSMIKWMQQTQNLPDLGENEQKIVAYLARYYAPAEQGRRKPLTEIEWYSLE